MGYDFDRLIDRRGTDCLKFDFAVEQGKRADILPLWVADMDFPVAPAIQQALIERCEHGIFGYAGTKEDYNQAVAGWFTRHHGWTPEARWMVKTPGVVFALATAVRACTQPGDAVLIQPPVYYPFFQVVKDNGRRLVENELLLRNGRYEIDFADLEQKFREEQVKLMLLCSLHNPVSRVWTQEELERLAALCLQYHVILAADEIHCDFTFPGHPFTSLGTLGPEILGQSLIFTAPSKTFNLAGLQVSNVFIPNDSLRRDFWREMRAVGYSQLNALGLLACKTAYSQCDDWLAELKDYLYGNLCFLRSYLSEKLPQLRLI